MILLKTKALALEQAIKSNLGEEQQNFVNSTPREERVLRMRFGVGMNTDHTLEGVCSFQLHEKE